MPTPLVPPYSDGTVLDVNADPRGQGDYSLSTYVHIVSAMREFIFNEAELLRVQEMFIKAAFCL